MTVPELLVPVIAVRRVAGGTEGGALIEVAFTDANGRDRVLLVSSEHLDPQVGPASQPLPCRIVIPGRAIGEGRDAYGRAVVLVRLAAASGSGGLKVGILRSELVDAPSHRGGTPYSYGSRDVQPGYESGLPGRGAGH